LGATVRERAAPAAVVVEAVSPVELDVEDAPPPKARVTAEPTCAAEPALVVVVREELDLVEPLHAANGSAIAMRAPIHPRATSLLGIMVLPLAGPPAGVDAWSLSRWDGARLRSFSRLRQRLGVARHG
jgi:hypothetical protein